MTQDISFISRKYENVVCYAIKPNININSIKYQCSMQSLKLSFFKYIREFELAESRISILNCKQCCVFLKEKYFCKFF